MLIRRLRESSEHVAGDKTRLRELLHPERVCPFNGRYSLAHASLDPGESSLPHRLKTDEVYYILKGSGEIHIDNESAIVETGDVVEIPPNAEQWIKNIGSGVLEFLCIVDPAWRAEDEELT